MIGLSVGDKVAVEIPHLSDVFEGTVVEITKTSVRVRHRELSTMYLTTPIEKVIR